MNRSIKNPIIFLLMIPVLVSFHTFAQTEINLPADFFMGKWGGTISGEVVDEQLRKYPFNLELVGYPAKFGIGPFGGGSTAWTRMDATWPGKFTVVYDTVFCGIFPQSTPPFFNILFPVSDPATITELGYYTVFDLGGFSIQVENKNVIHLTSGGADQDFWGDSYAAGELYRIYVKKDTLGKTIQINEPIKTDQFTQRDIVIPAVSEIPDFPYEIGEVYVFGNTDCIFTSENEMHLSSGEVVIFEDVNWKNIDMDKIVSSKPDDIELGEITTKLDKLREEGYDFKVRSPQAVLAVRGTQFITKVEEDGTTILTVLDGAVEFSDKQMRKTVLVKKNQKSVIKPGGLPAEPKVIEQNQIPKWWE